MSRLGFKSVVYHGDACLGELDTVPVNDQTFQFPNNEIRIHHISLNSERCPPLSILQTISSFSVRCKLESSSPLEQHHLINLHASCFHEFKTAVVLLGEEEIHLVAMPSKQKKFPCFWCFSVPAGLYNSCLGMLNLRCLAIVFDLDETLIVANTMKSFEDRIEALRAWIARETDPMRISGMSAELKRYMEDRMLLKQYTETDSVVDNGKVLKVQLEEVPPLSDTHERRLRPVVRLPERNIVLTRINPEIRDTSVLVRLRPAWEDLRSYLTAKGRKRFEVYVCTMAERDYALEMWRLLDPGAHLIGSKQLLNRVVCVKSGSRKSLLNVFRDGICHPKMAMVIDDRAKVWEDKDQPRVHVVPAFTPYYAPQAETANAVPVLCVARNVACNVRGCFFKEFDENLLRSISEVFYEDEVVNMPLAPDVSNYLMSEDASSAPNGNVIAPLPEGINGAEVDRRLNLVDEKQTSESANHSMRSQPSQPPFAVNPSLISPPSSTMLSGSQRPSLLGVPRRDGSSFDCDQDLKRRTLGLKHGVDLRSGQPPLISSFPSKVPASSAQPQGGWLVEEDMNKAPLLNRLSGAVQESAAAKSDKARSYQNPFSLSTPGPISTTVSSNAPQAKVEEAHVEQDSRKLNHPSTSHTAVVGVSQNPVSSTNRENQIDGGKLNQLPSHLSISVLHEIGRRCGSKVEFRSVVSTSKDLHFSVEVLFTGEKIGTGMGKTRKDAQQQAAEHALHILAEKYIAYLAPCSENVDKDLDRLSLRNENGFLWDTGLPESNGLLREELPKESTTEATGGENGSLLGFVHENKQKRVSLPRSPPSSSNKRMKDENLQSSQVFPSPRHQKEEQHVA